jgi:rubrerythrin
MADDPAELRAKILRYRELLKRVDDPAVREALRELIRQTNEKLNGHDAAKP